ncbi:MAG: DUF4330 domain-containing protein [Cyanobacteria bacterium]|nr:DUF4330 domain-containing protein [Cyanobacteriota bacterium]MDW8202378.1 DUF4330 domain-containing protein [Cyanobacteriota bacterium SKYGB_h_bin112]
MALVDQQGRLFGKISILDIGAALVILMVIIGIFFFPGTSGSIAQVGAKAKTVEVDVIVRGISSSNPSGFIKDIEGSKTVNIVVRNQPAGKMTIKAVKVLPRTVAVPQPDGKVVALPDPRPEAEYLSDLLFTLTGSAQVTDGGTVIGTAKLKIANQVELEGTTYNVTGGIVDVRVQS